MGEKWIIGIIGGVGSGKSRILEILREEYGAGIIQADEVAHKLMEPGNPGLARVVAALGTDFLKSDGSVDRLALAERIFHDEEAKRTVNGIIHPMACDVICRQALEAKETLVVIEAAIVEEKVHDICREIWYVYTSRDTRIERLMENRGYSREKCEAIMKNQWSDQQFRAVSQREIDNNKTLEEVRVQIRDTMRRIGRL